VNIQKLYPTSQQIRNYANVPIHLRTLEIRVSWPKPTDRTPYVTQETDRIPCRLGRPPAPPSSARTESVSYHWVHYDLVIIQRLSNSHHVTSETGTSTLRGKAGPARQWGSPLPWLVVVGRFEYGRIERDFEEKEKITPGAYS